MGGSGLPVIGKMLGHTQASTTAIYARLQTDSVKDAAEKATTAMLYLQCRGRQIWVDSDSKPAGKTRGGNQR